MYYPPHPTPLTFTLHCFICKVCLRNYITRFSYQGLNYIWRRHHYWLQIFIYSRHLEPLSIEVFLACHPNCDTGYQFIVVISEDPWHSQLSPSVWQRSCYYFFVRLRSFAAGIRTQPYAFGTNVLAHCATAAVCLDRWNSSLFI